MEDDAEPTASSVHDIAQLIGQVNNLIFSVAQVLNSCASHMNDNMLNITNVFKF